MSLILPNFNKSNFLIESLQSIKNQTYQNWEAIIVDDGSTDNSIEIIEKFCIRDARFQLIKLSKQQNGGSVCRNIGLQKAQGDFVIFFDSDDVLAASCLKKRLEFMTQHPEADFAVFTLQTFLNKPGDQSYLWIPKKEKALQRFLMHDLPWQTMQPIYKRDFLERNNLNFDERFPRMQDVEFHTSVLLKNPKFEVFNQVPDCYFRVNPNRKVFNPLEFYRQWAMSTKLLVEKFGMQSQKKKLLAHTVLMSISEIIEAKNSNELQKKEAIIYVNDVLYNWNSAVLHWLSLYAWLGIHVPFHIKGLRKLFKLGLNLL